MKLKSHQIRTVDNLSTRITLHVKKKKTTQIKFHIIFYLFTLQKGPWKQWKDLIQIYETTRFLNSLTLHNFFQKWKKKWNCNISNECLCNWKGKNCSQWKVSVLMYLLNYSIYWKQGFPSLGTKGKNLKGQYFLFNKKLAYANTSQSLVYIIQSINL